MTISCLMVRVLQFCWDRRNRFNAHKFDELDEPDFEGDLQTEASNLPGSRVPPCLYQPRSLHACMHDNHFTLVPLVSAAMHDECVSLNILSF